MARERSRERSNERSRDKKKSSKRRSRSRSPSRERRSRKHSSRDRSRDRSPSRRREREKNSNFSSAEQVQQYQALQAMQQQQLQKQLLSQQLLMQQQAMMGGASSGKKQREVYVGNLTIGAVTDVMLRELFNGALSHLMPNPELNPPVVNVGMDPSGRFGFVEMRTEELASSAMALDKVELCGRNINVGRPKGYVEPPHGHAPPAQLASAQLFAAQMGSGPTRVVLLKNMVKAVQVLDDQERQELMEDVAEESGKYGAVEGLAVPRPPPGVAPDQAARVYVKFAAPDQAAKVKDVFHGRQFDGNTIVASFSTEADYNRAAAGEWVPETGGAAPAAAAAVHRGLSPAALPPAPAMPSPMAGFLPGAMPGHAPPAAMMGGFVAGMAPVGAVPPAMPVHAAPAVPILDPAAMAVQEGWIKLRGIPFSVTKGDICTFLQGCGQMSEEKVRLVLGPDARPSGEAYVEISGPGANLRAALAKDRQVMPNSSRYVEIFTSTRDEVDRRALTGVMLV